ncbi:transcriptional activator, putative, Baf family [Synechococcus sp. PCC 7335]|uniref:pantothenate kinase n=1 Tax=Synechococcus sp. (strain ATCC 29403 / PCC 7335) TaxID=91464 RepID=UPI00017ED9B6|nr:pantothenate kinase [Synechococcus sp. PCC 7335]EDX84823.1 transcriptional activator, putative, Baf family [Synechococcus sp. PCC 7335]
MLSSWLALVVGNTRLHWAYFERGSIAATWHTHHLSKQAVERVDAKSYLQAARLLIDSLVSESKIPSLLQDLTLPIDLWVGSVVPSQTQLWQQVVPNLELVSRSRIPLNDIYPTLGIDRAINLLGANHAFDWPILVIDSGSALTLTAGVSSLDQSKSYDGSVYGGAILPGLGLQLKALGQQTADLGSLLPTISAKVTVERQLPERWARNSEGAIASGIIYSLTSTCIDYIQDWWRAFPSGVVVITGGDGPLLYQYLKQRTPEIASRVLIDDDLAFKGMQAYRRELTT